jgi:hypothetical protein
MNSPFLLIALGLAPTTLRRLVQNLPTTCYDVKTDPARFSLREAVAHIADWDPIHLARIQAAVENPGSSMPDIDEGARAVEDNYAERDPIEQAHRFEGRRAITLAFLRGLKAEDWNKTYVHSVKGEMTVFEYADTILGHDMYHIEHLTQYLPVQ